MEYLDITGKIGPLYDTTSNADWPMYSFYGPSMRVWGTVANRLHKRGWSEDKIKEWLQSKNARWAMDQSLGDALASAAAAYADRIPD